MCKSNIANQRKSEGTGIFKALNKPTVWKPFLTLFFFFALQQLSGIYVILFYAVTVLQDIGVTVDEYAATVAIGGVRLFAAILGAGLAKSVGRKQLACVSGLGMALSAAGVALSIRYTLPSWVPLTCMGGHVGFSMIGYLTLPWVMTSELYLLRFRGPLGGLTTGLAQMMTFAAIKTYPDLRIAIGVETTMWVFCTSGLVGAIFAMTVLPETRGRSLHQIENTFNKSGGKNSYNANITTIDVQPQIRNVSLQRFRAISEDVSRADFSMGVRSALDHWNDGYDNRALDITTEELNQNPTFNKSNKDDTINDSDKRLNVKRLPAGGSTPYEQVYV